MPIDYTLTDKVVMLSFAKLDKSTAKLKFPPAATLSNQLAAVLSSSKPDALILEQKYFEMLATAGVEMWHRAIHSFLWSVALTKTSHIWASVTGYYASHFVMRAFAHSMGIFKSFRTRKAVQVVINKGRFVYDLQDSDGEHSYYWKVVKGHSRLSKNPLFRTNSERDLKSDSSHRTFANYTDHLDSFVPLSFPSTDNLAETVEKISRIRLHSITEPSRESYPDLQNVQILAFQRIVAFHDYLEDLVPNNRFWRAHRRPQWCKDLMIYQVEDQEMETPLQL